MGEASYQALLKEDTRFACRTYAPVGGHKDLLAYLVRRLLENGANSSFVAVAGDPEVPVADLLVRPQARLGRRSGPRTARSRCRPISMAPLAATPRASSSAIATASPICSPRWPTRPAPAFPPPIRSSTGEPRLARRAM